MKEPKGKWITSLYTIDLDDGSTARTYAKNQKAAELVWGRFLTRIRSDRKVVPKASPK